MLRSAFIAVVIALTSTGCPTVDLGDVPPDPGQCRPDPVYYETVIWPEFLAPANPEISCVNDAGCHRSEDGRSAFRLLMPPAGAPQQIDHNANYGVVSRFLNCGAPEASSLLSKPVGGVDPHGGGDLFTDADPSTQIFLDWFAQ